MQINIYIKSKIFVLFRLIKHINLDLNGLRDQVIYNRNFQTKWSLRT